MNEPASGPLPPAALCIGHPGHELRVFQWCRLYKPHTSILTDGSGPDRPSRIESTRRALTEIGATPGSIFGKFPDREIYRLMLEKDPGPFIELARELAEEWDEAGIEMVAGDMVEGFNTSHDICRILINAAVEFLRRKRGRSIRNLEFPLEDLAPSDAPEGSLVIMLNSGELDEKRKVAMEFYPEISGEVERAIAKFGTDSFRHETLLPADPEGGLTWNHDEAPFYERYGAGQIEKGHYHDLITFKDHIQPLGRAIWAWACDE